MQLQFNRRFLKQYARLPLVDRKKVDHAILLFRDNPFHPQLKTHKLIGKQKCFYAFKAGYDLRVIFQEKDGFTEVLLLDLGSHDQVYR